MDLRDSLIQRILKVESNAFEQLALDIARFQYRNNTLYRQYCDLVGRIPDKARDLRQLAFLPVQFFKQTLVSSNAQSPAIVFESSTTTAAQASRHGLWQPDLYTAVARRGFAEAIRRPVSDLTWLGLLPSYLERPYASLVHMIRDFISLGGPDSGFFLNDFDALASTLARCEQQAQPTVMFGVSFALMDFAQAFPMPLEHTVIIETGGMKGRRTEITRNALHAQLCAAFGVMQIGSEYGMTELLSQAWSAGNGLFHCAPTLRVLTREVHDPLQLTTGRRGALNCIDLANIDSCSFIATDDAGLVLEDGSFYMFGRLDGSEQRGCNLMVMDVPSG